MEVSALKITKILNEVQIDHSRIKKMINGNTLYKNNSTTKNDEQQGQ